MNTQVAQYAQPWFSYDNSGPFKGPEPFYFNTDDFPWVREVEAQWEVIRDELLNLTRQHSDSLLPYPIEELTSKPKQWKTFSFMFWTLRTQENCAKCPRSWEILRKIPNITAASLNLLEGKTTIKPHHGDTNAIIRCHLGLIIPGDAPLCAFRVGTETRGWNQGKFLMFCDAYAHTAWNNTDQQRYILVLDIMRPEFVDKRNSTCSRVLASIYADVAYQNKAWLKKYFGNRLGRKSVFWLFRTAFAVRLAIAP